MKIKWIIRRCCSIITFLAVLQGGHTFAQSNNLRLQGRALDEKYGPLVNASIRIKELKITVQTNKKGEYFISNLKPGTYTLQVSHIGKSEQVHRIVIDRDKIADFVLLNQVKNLSEVVVSAPQTINENPISIGKIAIHPMDLPQSMTVIDAEVIRQQQALRLSDVIKNVNGVYLATTRGNSQEMFYARGNKACCENMFKDGFRTHKDAVPEMSSLEKLEILKGSAAVLYGDVAPGGVINMVTKQPKFERGGTLTMRTGSYGLYKPEVDFYGPINSSIAYRINGTYEQAESFRNNVSSKRYYINPSLLFKVSSKSELLVQADYLNHQFTPDFGTAAIDNKIIELHRSVFFGAAWANALTQQATTSATLSHRFNTVWQLNVKASYQWFKRNYQSTERIQPQSNGDWERPLGKYETWEDRYAGQINLTGKFKTGNLGHTLLIGSNAERFLNTNYTYAKTNKLGGAKEAVWTYLDGDNTLRANYDRINILDLNKYTPRTDFPIMNPFEVTIAPIHHFGLYASDLIDITNRMKLLAGIRWSYIQALPVRTTDLRSNEIIEKEAKLNQAFSPRLGLVYKVGTNTSLFTSYANSFVINNARDINGNPLKPSLIDQYEVGIKNNFFKGMLAANLTFYRIVNNNLAQMALFAKDGVTINNDTNIKELTGQTTGDGVELDLSGRPLKGLNILGGYSYNFTRYTKTSNVKGSYIEGERLVNTPTHTANASIFYEFSGRKLKGLQVGVSANYIGERMAGWNRTVADPKNKQPFAVPEFTTFDLSLGYSYKRFSLLGKVSNVGNTLNYYVHENYSVNPIPPRQFSTTLTYKL